MTGSGCNGLNPAYFKIAAAIWAFSPAFLTLFCLVKGLFKFGPEHPQGPGSHQTVALFGGLWFVLIFAFKVKILYPQRALVSYYSFITLGFLIQV